MSRCDIHAANLVTDIANGHGGQTAYQRVWSREFRTRLTTFGEKCMFMSRSHEPLSGIADGRRFHEGVLVGSDRRTGQYMIHSGAEIKLAMMVVRVPEAKT